MFIKIDLYSTLNIYIYFILIILFFKPGVGGRERDLFYYITPIN